MKNCINRIKECVPSKELEGIKRSFNSPWADEVHLSFEVYINICQKEIEILKECYERAKKICDSIGSLDVSTQISQAKATYGDVHSMSICVDQLVAKGM